MPEYLRPGVYIEEIERGPRPIEGVPTSTAAFLGETERGPLRPTLVTSYGDYRRIFGGPFRDGRYMPYAANGFFENGGKRMYVCRIVGRTAVPSAIAFGNFTFRAVGPGSWGDRVHVRIEDGSTKDSNKISVGFRLRLLYWSEITDAEKALDPYATGPGNEANERLLRRADRSEDYDDLSVDPQSSEFFEKRLIDSTTNRPVSALAMVIRGAAAAVNERPAAGSAGFLANGVDEPDDLTPADFVGETTPDRTELQGIRQLELDPFREISLVYAPRPPAAPVDVALELITHCERSKFRFAVVDCARDDSPADLDPRTTITDTTFAAFYCPWIIATDPESGARVVVPPGGHVLGVYARTDTERGVWKAPANDILRGALDLRHDINDGQQDVINPRGVNATRRFPGRGIRVWGARTLSSNALWKYVSVRRLFIFLERSIYEGTQWVVFEPNDERLWARVKDTIRLFLRTQWRAGALFGAKEEDAFFITCDRTTMTQDDILNGRLICEIGIAPVRPAEFVIFRIFQHTAEARN
jgi:uncharacterized protein